VTPIIILASVACVFRSFETARDLLLVLVFRVIVKSMLPDFQGWLSPSAESPMVGADVKPLLSVWLTLDVNF
jgi:hypothetical protein